ncbi:two component transcriptional regulator, LytTR family [Chitinophaga sp. YR573]|uniref:LytR/AlgR family response regulator transcription factor n=1 Tax=Chitinophaga sp. YR573 TaxID=1881040 RepID=UPI0008CAC0A7|nr:LytTR family DNA-binding domain-containing protein [Chitinophaga sp. YR573]SEV91784.1 two component transcriptional regulator, LytTR family [Chitinophaga sp. YR573]
MIRAIALDDEPPALNVLQTFCEKVETIVLERTFTGTEDALKYLEQSPVDLLFLDINMPALSGIDFYKSLPQKIMVIFTTAYSEYAVESYNLSAIDYLLKPFTFKRFQQAIDKADKYLRLEQPKDLVLRIDYGLVKIVLTDILFIEAYDNYLKIHVLNIKPVIIRMTMKALLSSLPADVFIRVHRSYIVSLNHIEHVRNKVISVAGQKIPLGSSYEESFFHFFKGA